MSYTEKIRELFATELPKQKNKRELLLSGILCNALFEANRIEATFASPFAAYAVKDLVRLLRNISATVTEKPFASRTDHTVVCENGKLTVLISEYLKYADAACAMPEDLAYFLRGIFLSCGRISDPNASEAYLELSFSEEEIAVRIRTLLENAALPVPGISKRRSKYVVYFKSRDKICDILTAMDSGHFVFEYLNRSIYKSLEWNERRAINLISGNINRAVIAGEKQTAACLYMLEHNGGALLSPELYTTACLRINFPNLSLSELAALHTPPLTKSGINHRLQKIAELAKKYGCEDDAG